MSEEQEYENITAEDYIKFLHISISHIDNKRDRDEAIEHLFQVKEQLANLENCYSLKAYEHDIKRSL